MASAGMWHEVLSPRPSPDSALSFFLSLAFAGLAGSQKGGELLDSCLLVSDLEVFRHSQLEDKGKAESLLARSC